MRNVMKQKSVILTPMRLHSKTDLIQKFWNFEGMRSKTLGYAIDTIKYDRRLLLDVFYSRACFTRKIRTISVIFYLKLRGEIQMKTTWQLSKMC